MTPGGAVGENVAGPSRRVSILHAAFGFGLP
jgi:hypothetical protein